MNLCLLQIADSALPISGYTHSWGLETAILTKKVHDPQTLETWTSHWLRHSLAPFEGALVSASFQAASMGERDKLFEYNRMVEVSILPPSIRNASREMGEQLIALGSTWAWSSKGLRAILPAEHIETPGWHHSVAFGLMGAVAQAEQIDVLTAFLHQSVIGMIGAGVRAIPLGHTHGQQVLAYLQDDIRTAVETLCKIEPEAIGSTCPYYEVLCDEQTRLYARMFRS